MNKIINLTTHQVEIPAGYRPLGRTVQPKPGDYFTTPASDEWTPTKNDGTTKRNPFSPRAYIRPLAKTQSTPNVTQSTASV